MAVRSYEDPVLPILDLPVQQHLVALPRTTEIVPQNLRSELDPSVIRRQRSDLPPVSGRSATAEPATGAAFFLN